MTKQPNAEPRPFWRWRDVTGLVIMTVAIFALHLIGGWLEFGR